VDCRYWCGFCDAAFFDNVLLIVDGRYWCGFCDAVFFDNVLLIVTIYDEENVIKEHCITERTPIPTIYDEENVIKECCITEATPIPTIYDEENVVVLLIVDGRYWCGFCDAAFFDNVLLIVDGRYWLVSVMQRSLITFSSS
jgi:hypothetical protein